LRWFPLLSGQVGSETHDPNAGAVVIIVWSAEELMGTLVPFTLDVVVTADPALLVVSPVKAGNCVVASEPEISLKAGWAELGIPPVEMLLIHW
jgi:hypothetical protein